MPDINDTTTAPTLQAPHGPGPSHPALSAAGDAVVRLGQVALAFGRVKRATFHEDGTTPESDTDHTVMLGLVACALAAAWYPHLDQGVVAQLALVHDLVEVYAGDTPTITIDDAGLADKQRREAAAARQLEHEFGTCLPWIPATIGRYEDQVVAEARFVKAVDKLLPKITHLLNGGAMLLEQHITRTELDDSWTRQAASLARYAGDFPELLDLTGELVGAVTASCIPAGASGEAS